MQWLWLLSSLPYPSRLIGRRIRLWAWLVGFCIIATNLGFVKRPSVACWSLLCSASAKCKFSFAIHWSVGLLAASSRNDSAQLLPMRYRVRRFFVPLDRGRISGEQRRLSVRIVTLTDLFRKKRAREVAFVTTRTACSLACELRSGRHRNRKWRHAVNDGASVSRDKGQLRSYA